MNQQSPTESPLRTDKELFFEALDLPAAGDRSAFLERACVGDAAKRARLEVLLANHFQQPVFMADSAVERSALAPETLGEDLDAVIGRYKLLEKLGEGGRGRISTAEFSPDDQRIVAAANGEVVIWEAASPEQVARVRAMK